MYRFPFALRSVFAAFAIVAVVVSSMAGPGIAKASAATAGTHSISGHVFLGGSNRSALAGEVTITATQTPLGSYPPVSVTTDANGDYVIPGLAPWFFVVTFHDSVSTKFADLAWPNTPLKTRSGFYDQLNLQDADASGITVTLPSPATLSGTISLGTAGTKASPGDAAVSYERWDDTIGYTPISQPVSVSVGGTFAFPSLAAGVYRLSVSYLAGSGFQNLVGDTFVFMGSTDQTVRSLVLKATSVISGHAYLGATGTPPGAGQVTVALEQASRDRASWTSLRTTTTDSAGGYSFSGLSDSEFRLVFTPTSGHGIFTLTDYPVGQYQTLTTSLVGHDVVLDPGQTISGHVALGSANVSAAAGSVEVEFNYYPSMGWPIPHSVVVDNQGNFTTPELRAGTYFLYFRYTGTGNFVSLYWPQDRSLTPASAITVGTHDLTGLSITLPAGNGIAGVVTHSGSAVAGATVYADMVDENRNVISESSTTTDRSGAYRFQQLQTGDYEMTFVGPGRTFADQTWFDLPIFYVPDLVHLSPTTFADGIDADLHLVGSISGQVVGAGISAADYQKGAVTAQLYVFDSASSSWVDTGVFFPVTARTGGGGQFTATDLAPDSYKIEIVYSGPRGSSSFLSPSISVDEDNVSFPTAVTLALPQLPQATVGFIRALYGDFLKREPSQQEISGWGTRILGGFPRGQVANGFVDSAEYRLIRIDAAYKSILGRPSDAGGRLGWLAGMQKGTLTTDDVDKAFLGSQEFYNRSGGSDDLFAEALYERLIGRTATFPERFGWAFQVYLHGRAWVINQIWNSVETARARVSTMYQLYLGRVADYGGTVSWGDYSIAHGDSAVRSALTGSDEYYAHAAERFPSN